MKLHPASRNRLATGLVLCAIIPVGFGVNRLLGGQSTPASANTGQTQPVELTDQVIVVDDVGYQTLEDTIVLHGQVTNEETFVLYAGGEGLVTAVEVEVDDRVEAGMELMRLDGRPMLAVDLATPFWRPLSRASLDGADVVMLEEFLVEQGYDPGPVDDLFDADTTEALEEWQEDHGYPVDGVFRPTDVAIGAWPATIGQIDLEVGSVVRLGQPLVGFVDDELSAQISIDPSDRSRLEIGLAAVVTVAATDTEGTGTITELSDRTELDQLGNEYYHGEIQLDQNLGVADGTEVRVEVVLARVDNAMVVPVAAVLLNGDGQEEVRIVNRWGTIDRVPVVTGLADGAMVEIIEGLAGAEQVVVDVKYE